LGSGKDDLSMPGERIPTGPWDNAMFAAGTHAFADTAFDLNLSRNRQQENFVHGGRRV